jgi:homoserine kinase
MGLLLSGLADRRRLVPEATEDRLHQEQRTPLFPAAPGIIAGLVDAGAAAACWSGAGPTLLAICDTTTADAVRAAGDLLLEGAQVPGRSLRLDADRTGLVVERA